MVEISDHLLDVVGSPEPQPPDGDSSSRPRTSQEFGRLEVLKGVSLEVKRREVVLIIGPSGSGKTTFLRCINHLEKINGGTIYVNGQLIGYRETERQAGRGPRAQRSPRSAATSASSSSASTSSRT